MGGVDDVQAVGDQAFGPGLRHHLVKELLKALSPQALAEAAEGGVIGRQFLGAQTQEPLEHHVPGGLLFQLAVREVVEELQKDQLEHEHRIPRVPAPVHVEVLQGRFDESKVLGPGELIEEMGAPAQKLIIDEVAQEGVVGAAGLAHVASREIYFPDITTG